MDPAVNCASLVAYLEGCHELRLPKHAHDVTLPNLERRVLALERRFGDDIPAPSPSEMSTWNAMVWRLWRVQSRSAPRVQPDMEKYYHVMAGMLKGDGDGDGDGDMIRVVSLGRLLDRLGPDLPELRCPRDEQGAAAAEEECEGCVGAIIQKLAYLGGRHALSPLQGTLSKRIIYAYAASLSFALDWRGARPWPRADVSWARRRPNMEDARPRRPERRASTASDSDSSRSASPSSSVPFRGRRGGGVPDHASFPPGSNDGSSSNDVFPFSGGAFVRTDPGVSDSHVFQHDTRREAAFSPDVPVATGFHYTNVRRETAFEDGIPHRAACNQNMHHGTGLDQDVSPSTKFNQTFPPAAAVNDTIPQGAAPDHGTAQEVPPDTKLHQEATVDATIPRPASPVQGLAAATKTAPLPSLRRTSDGAAQDDRGSIAAPRAKLGPHPDFVRRHPVGPIRRAWSRKLAFMRSTKRL